MHLFLSGGGAGSQTAAAYEVFTGLLDRRRPLLVLPIAMEPHQYMDCFRWVMGELRPYGITDARMVPSPQALAREELQRYAGLYICGGNTFRLLQGLQSCGCMAQIRAYLAAGGIVFGSSAGCAVFGADIGCCAYADANDVHLTDTRGLDVLPGVSFTCHFTNEGPARTETARGFLLRWSRGRRVLALPEETTLYLRDGAFQVLGSGGVYEFRDGLQR